MFRITSVTLAFLLAGAASAFAQFPAQPPPAQMQGNEKERAACHPDVVKYCQAELTANQDDVFAILSCLQRNRSRISAACQNVLTSHGQ